MRSVVFGVCVSTMLLSCGGKTKTGSSSSEIKKAWNGDHHPSLMDTKVLNKDYVFKFTELSLKAKLSRQPWSDDFWPQCRGGISYRWNYEEGSDYERTKYKLLTRDQISKFDLKILSPTEKLDIYLGRYEFPFTVEERIRTEIFKSIEIPFWEGLCDAWAPATLFFEEPGPVVMKSKTGVEVPFGSSDVKALLVYFVKKAAANVQFLGTRCDESLTELNKLFRVGIITKAEYDQRLEICSGVNAGAFHVVLTNQIARLDEGFIINKDRGPEVWNQSVYGYTSKVLSDHKRASPGAALGTVREIELQTELEYIEEITQSWEKATESGIEILTYHYRVELNKHGEIIGGAWYNEERPGFMWKQDKPAFFGQPVFKVIKEIYDASLAKKLKKETPKPEDPKKIKKPRHHHNPLIRLLRH